MDRRPRPIVWLREHPAQADLMLAIVLTIASVSFHLIGVESLSPSEERDPTWWSTVLAVAGVFPIAWRRSHPIQVALVVTVSQVVFTALDFVGTGFIGVLIAIYSVGAHSIGVWRGRALAAIASMISVLFIAGLFVDELVIADFLSSTIILITAFVLGDNLRRRREAAQAMAERAERAERERDLLAHQRVAAERARIARELHDVVAHSVSAMVIQATAAKRSLESRPAQAAEALGNIETLGRRAMDELRGTLGVLRASSAMADDNAVESSAPATAPQPTLADVATVIDEASDLPIHAQIGGDMGEVPPAVGLAAYRIVQEALTNVRRHGGTVSRVDVTIERRGEVIHLEVLDDGRGAAADHLGEPGYGILGMQERVEAIGGFVVSEHRVGGGWQVYAELPLSRSARVASGVNS